MLTIYQSDLKVIAYLRRQIKRAIQVAAFNVRAGTDDQKLLYDAVFSNKTKFGIEEAVLLTYSFSFGDNDLRVLREAATDAQVQTCVDAILSELITRQLDSSRGIIGLD